jgi:hypothetical protein
MSVEGNAGGHEAPTDWIDAQAERLHPGRPARLVRAAISRAIG